MVFVCCAYGGLANPAYWSYTNRADAEAGFERLKRYNNGDKAVDLIVVEGNTCAILNTTRWS